MNNKFKLKVLISDTFDPWFNIATENFIFRDLLSSEELNTTKILYLWRNDKTVVIGRFQNPWSECNTAKMELDGVKLARRHSGGGAVYHDLGNTNFTFLSGKSSFDKNANTTIITRAVNSFGLSSYASGRNDLLVSGTEGERKFSGSAFKETKDRSFHHGTLLINSDLEKLATYLNPSKKKLQTKGILSVRARVANLSEFNSTIGHENLQQAIIREFFDYYQTQCSIELLEHNFLSRQPQLNEHFIQMSDWNWRFGESPEFNHQMNERFSWGEMDVRFNVLKAKIIDCRIFSDSLHPEMIELLMHKLMDVAYNKHDISFAIDKVISDLPMISDYLEEFKSWLLEQVE